MTDDAERWKEKYLKSLEQHEKVERRWDARLDLLRRGLVRSTLAAEGSDKAVDACMKEMREVIRSDSMDAGLAALIPRLETAVLDSEHRRETRMNQVTDALTSLVTQLQGLALPGDLNRSLKKLAKKLDGGLSQSRELPPLLGELSGLQEQALATLRKTSDESRPGLLQRLFGGREGESAAGSETTSADTSPTPPSPDTPAAPTAATAVEANGPVAETPAPAPDPQPASAPPVSRQPIAAEPASLLNEPVTLEPVEPEPVAQKPADPVEPVDAADSGLISEAPEPGAAPVPEPATQLSPAVTPATAPVVVPVAEMPAAAESDMPQMSPGLSVDELFGPPSEPYALPHAIEPPYSQVAAHIEQTLLGLLDDLSLPERHKAQALDMRERVARGLNWYELIPVLDDLAVLLLAITDSGQHEFGAYLQQLNERLDTFQVHLQDASAGHADNSEAARELDSQLREQVDGLQTSVKGASDLDSLKLVVENRLEGLLGVMDAHQHQRDRREQDLAARLHGLAERVASMEQEALGYREHLEEQRQKALIDPLTGLPNRAAWSEQLEQQVQAWEAHGGHLLMAILDLDHFKRINDGYGHLAGDKVLKIVANVLSKRLRPDDFIARFGGEEFVLLMARTPLELGAQIVESLRAAIEACPFHFKGEPVTITTSIGLSAFRPGERSEAVLRRADKALYRAKELGRNRIEQG